MVLQTHPAASHCLACMLVPVQSRHVRPMAMGSKVLKRGQKVNTPRKLAMNMMKLPEVEKLSVIAQKGSLVSAMYVSSLVYRL